MSAAATATATPSSGTSTMKLLVDKASQRVLFAEAGKDVVDFLFGLLTMPLCTAASLLGSEDAADALGSVANVYASVENMDAAYMQCQEARDALVVNTSLPSGPSTRLLPTSTTSDGACATCTAATANNTTMAPGYNYNHYGGACANCGAATANTTMAPGYKYNHYGGACATCGTATASTTMAPAGYYVWPSSAAGMHAIHPGQACQPPYYPTTAPAPQPESAAVGLLPPPDAAGDLALLPPSLYRCHACYALGSPQGSSGFVQGLASYTVMDDLTVKPTSNVSTVALLATLGVKDLDALEERTVTIGRKECLEILKVGLKSKTVLTDVFLAKKNPAKTKKRVRAAGDEDNDEAASASE
ncbi:unnamed protein product [Urochloa humidicola]